MLTGHELKILRALESPKRTGDISNEAKINKTGIYKMLHRLEKKGLIEKYYKVYHLTQNGREVLQSYAFAP